MRRRTGLSYFLQDHHHHYQYQDLPTPGELRNPHKCEIQKIIIKVDFKYKALCTLIKREGGV